MRRASAFLLVLAGVALAGCGGGGGSGATYPLGYTMRLLAVGDRWDYRLTGTATAANGSRASLTGTAAVSILQQVIGSHTFMASSAAMDLRSSAGGSIVSSVLTYGDQDPSTRDFREYAEVSDGDPMRIVTNSPLPVVLPGSWGNSTAFAVTLLYSDSSTCTSTLSVAAIEIVRVPAGSFTTWRTTETYTDSLYGNMNETCWYAPQLGCTVKETMSKTYPDGSRLDGTSELTSTNVPLT